MFLRTEEKKRGALLAKATKETPPETPIEAVAFASAPLPEAASSQEQPSEDAPSAIEGHDGPAPGPNAEDGEGIKEETAADTDMALSIIPTHEAQDIPHASIEVRLAPAISKANHKVKRGPPNTATQEIAPGQEQDDDRSNVDDASITAGEVEAVAASAGMGGMGGGNPMMGTGGAGGINPMMGMMPGMNGMGEMNQMQQMQMMMAMQSGFGGFGMMGTLLPFLLFLPT